MIYVDNRASAGFEVLKELISTFPSYRESYIALENNDFATSLLFSAYYDHHMPLALYLIDMGREQHPFYTFFLYAFESSYYDDYSHEFSEKIEILDAINNGYNFTEKFKSDYIMLKQHEMINPQNPCQSHKLTIKNLIIFNHYVKMREMSTNELFGEVEYNRLKKIIPELTEVAET